MQVNKTNILKRIGKTTPAILLAGIALLIVMLFSIAAAFASVSSDQNEVNLNPKSVQFNSQNVATITNRNVADVTNSDEKLDLNFDVFKVEYKNDSDEIIVKSDNGEKVVAPGTDVAEDNATFTIENYSEAKLDIDCDFYNEFSEDAVPLEIKMIGPDGRYYVGSETEYDDPLKINNVSTKHTVMPGETFTYQFPWRWEFEQSATQDKIDTNLGNKTVTHPVKITLGINKETPTPDPPSPDPEPELWPAQTSDALLITVVIFGSIAAIAFAVLLIWKKKRSEKGSNV